MTFWRFYLIAERRPNPLRILPRQWVWRSPHRANVIASLIELILCKRKFLKIYIKYINLDKICPNPLVLRSQALNMLFQICLIRCKSWIIHGSLGDCRRSDLLPVSQHIDNYQQFGAQYPHAILSPKNWTEPAFSQGYLL